jgi:purine-cytosine permease-like protein
MFIGHFAAWILAGIMGAGAGVLLGRTIGPLDPGDVASQALGVVGSLAVIVAGWTTSIPTLYRAGLALQTITPNWKRWKVTLVAGAITTTAALFPALMKKLLDFVALYGLILMPMGAVIFADYWLLPRMGMRREYAELKQLMVSVPAAVSWLGTLAGCFLLNRVTGLEIFFLGLPGWFIATSLFVGLSYLQQTGVEQLPVLQETGERA